MVLPGGLQALGRPVVTTMSRTVIVLPGLVELTLAQNTPLAGGAWTTSVGA